MNRKKIRCATSFGKEGMAIYGNQMVNSFIRYWPKDVMLVVYLDDMLDAKKLPTAPNVTYVLLKDKDLLAFKARNGKDPRKHGLTDFRQNDSNNFGKNSEGHWKFQFDAIRFSHKVFAFNDLARSGCDIAIWLDGDSKTFADVTMNDIQSWLPENKMSAFLDRPQSYTETGFHMFDMNFPDAIKFFDRWIEYYKTDSIFKLSAWTDCHTYDAARRQFDQNLWHSLSPSSGGSTAAHVFINGPLGKFMDHMKGKRKLVGKSNKKDLFVARTEDYWKNP